MNARLEMLIDDIVVEDRARADVGDLTSLMRSISELGLLQPVGVSQDGALVFGERRLEACRALGFTTIPVRFLPGARDQLHALRSELDENIERRQFTPLEAAALRRRIKDLSAAVKRDGKTSDTETPNGEDESAAGSQRDVVQVPATSRVLSAAEVDAQVAQVTGYSLTTLKRVDRISEFVNCGDPATEEAARDALKRIEAGAPVKPLLDKVVELHQAAEAAARGYVPERPAPAAPANVGPVESRAEHASLDTEPEATAPEPEVPTPAAGIPGTAPANAPTAPRGRDAFEPVPDIEPQPVIPVLHPGWDDIVEVTEAPEMPPAQPAAADASERPAGEQKAEEAPADPKRDAAVYPPAASGVVRARELTVSAARAALDAVTDTAPATVYEEAAVQLEETARRLRAVAATLLADADADRPEGDGFFDNRTRFDLDFWGPHV